MTTPAQTRRRALLALLDQYPIAREAFLHDGRRTASPRDEFADKIEALFAAAAHDPHTIDQADEKDGA